MCITDGTDSLASALEIAGRLTSHRSRLLFGAIVSFTRGSAADFVAFRIVMANRPTLPCRQPGCSALIPGGGFCEAHARPAFWNHLPLPQGWTTTVRRILRRDPICYICRTAKATTVDHIISRADGGSDDDGNLAGACQPCHDRKSQMEAARGRRH